MKHATKYVAVIDNSDAGLTVLRLPKDDMSYEEMLNWLVKDQCFNLSNCDWSIITSINIFVTL